MTIQIYFSRLWPVRVWSLRASTGFLKTKGDEYSKTLKNPYMLTGCQVPLETKMRKKG